MCSTEDMKKPLNTFTKNIYQIFTKNNIGSLSLSSTWISWDLHVSAYLSAKVTMIIKIWLERCITKDLHEFTFTCKLLPPFQACIRYI